jgi:plasmid maintenance system antidote protein VapI
MALRFSRLAAGTPDLYLHMQEGYDLWHAARKLRKELARIKLASRKAA